MKKKSKVIRPPTKKKSKVIRPPLKKEVPEAEAEVPEGFEDHWLAKTKINIHEYILLQGGYNKLPLGHFTHYEKKTFCTWMVAIKKVMENQKNSCPICHKSNKSICVDVCDCCGDIRAILCPTCFDTLQKYKYGENPTPPKILQEYIGAYYSEPNVD